MRSALGGVTSGLSIAFSTTFIALIGVVPVMMLSSSLRKREEDLLLSVEEYCLEDLLPNLHVHPDDEVFEDTVGSHLEQMAEFSENWRRQVSPLLDSVQKHSKNLSAQVAGLQPLIQKFSESFFEVKEEFSQRKQEKKLNSANTETEKDITET